MTEKENKKENMWKRALEQRRMESLSSNFNHRMMEHVHKEAVKRRKRKVRLAWSALIASSLFLLALCVYFLCFYLDIRFADSRFSMDIGGGDVFLFKFYGIIALLALVLLGLDYWLRKKYIWK